MPEFNISLFSILHERVPQRCATKFGMDIGTEKLLVLGIALEGS
jgi:hypothetical protein